MKTQNSTSTQQKTLEVISYHNSLPQVGEFEADGEYYCCEYVPHQQRWKLDRRTVDGWAEVPCRYSINSRLVVEDGVKRRAHFITVIWHE